jgi:hypothetical protein
MQPLLAFSSPYGTLCSVFAEAQEFFLWDIKIDIQQDKINTASLFLQ